MFEQLFNRIPFAKIVTVLAIVFGISLGLCGVTVVLSLRDNSGGNFLNGLGMLVGVGLLLSLIGLLLTFLVFVTLRIFRGSSEEVSQLKLSSEGEDKTKDKKKE